MQNTARIWLILLYTPRVRVHIIAICHKARTQILSWLCKIVLTLTRVKLVLVLTLNAMANTHTHILFMLCESSTFSRIYPPFLPDSLHSNSLLVLHNNRLVYLLTFLRKLCRPVCFQVIRPQM